MLGSLRVNMLGTPIGIGGSLAVSIDIVLYHALSLDLSAATRALSIPYAHRVATATEFSSHDAEADNPKTNDLCDEHTQQ